MLLDAILIVVTAVLMVITAAARAEGVHMAYAHMALSAAMAIVFFMAYLRTSQTLQREGASKSKVAANTSRYIGLVWVWGALGLAVTYGTGVLSWREWPLFLTACIVLAGLSLFLAALLEKDAQVGREDAVMLRIGRILAMVLLAGMLITMVGLVVDGKMTRFLIPHFTDWPANNIFFFGAVAMALISGYALLQKQE